MAGQPTDTYDAYDAGTSNREDLADIIYNIAPTETPFLMGAQRGTATNKKHEWLVDDLETSAGNLQIEAEDYAGEARTQPVRLHTYTQISAKALTVSGTQEVIDKAGRKSEIAYLLALQAKEIKRDMERQIVGLMSTTDATAFGGVAGESYPLSPGTPGGASARSTGCLRAWYETNTSLGVGGVDNGHSIQQPDDDDNTSEGTPRALLESQVKAMIRDAWTEGGNPTTIITNPFNKQAMSAFTGGTTRFDHSEDKRLVTAIDIYVSDFGEHRIIPDRFLKNENSDTALVHILDMNYWCIDYLRPFQQTPLAKTGDSEKRLLLVEWALVSKNEKASAVVADVSLT